MTKCDLRLLNNDNSDSLIGETEFGLMSVKLLSYQVLILNLDIFLQVQKFSFVSGSNSAKIVLQVYLHLLIMVIQRCSIIIWR